MPSLMVLVVEVILVVDVKVCLPLVERPRPHRWLLQVLHFQDRREDQTFWRHP